MERDLAEYIGAVHAEHDLAARAIRALEADIAAARAENERLRAKMRDDLNAGIEGAHDRTVQLEAAESDAERWGMMYAVENDRAERALEAFHRAEDALAEKVKEIRVLQESKLRADSIIAHLATDTRDESVQEELERLRIGLPICEMELAVARAENERMRGHVWDALAAMRSGLIELARGSLDKALIEVSISGARAVLDSDGEVIL